MARLYKRGRVWWAWGYYANGERWAESTQQRDRAAAARKADLLERARAAVDRAEVTPLHVEQALHDVIAARQREGKSPHTIDDYRRKGGHVVRLLGFVEGGAPRDAHDLTLGDLEDYIDQRSSEGAMRSTIDIELRKLRAALLYAAKHKRYRGNVREIWPSEALRGAHVPHERYLTREEYARLSAALPEERADYLAAYVFTGARRSEIWRVEADDVNLAHNVLRIRGTKTSGADRFIPIAEELRPVVERRLREADGPLWPEYDEWEMFQRACKRAAIGSVSANDLRRTFCSWLAQAGVPLLVTVRLMGHKSARMVERVYAHFGSDDLQDAIGRLSHRCSSGPDGAGEKPQNSNRGRKQKRGVSLDKTRDRGRSR